MIVIELIRATRPGGAELAARLRADGREMSVDGPEPALIDPSQPVLSLRNGRTIRCDDDPEEWVRGLAASFRTPYLSACIVEDTATAQIPSADLSVTKSGPLTARPGQKLTYTITATNNGPSDASNVSLQDAIPANTTLVSAVQTTGPPFSCSGALVCTPNATGAALAGGASATFHVVVRVNAGVHAGTTIANTATVSSSVTDPDESNNSATADTVIASKGPDLAVGKSGPASVVPGKNASYFLRVTNAGSSAMLDDALSDPLPAGTRFVSLVQTAGPAFACVTPAVGSAGTVVCSVDQLQIAQSARFKLVVAVDPALTDHSTLVNTATVSSDSIDVVDADDTATVDSAVTASADLLLTKHGPAAAVAGKAIGYTLAFRNKGPSEDTSVELRDPLPAGTTFVSLTQTGGTPASCTTPAVGANGTVTCDVASLGADAFASFKLVVATSASLPGGSVVSNTASVSGLASDPDASNDAATVETTLSASADLGVTNVAAPASVLRNHSLGFTIKLVNHGPSDAQAVELSDLLPAGTTFKSLTQTAGVPLSCTTPSVGSGGSVDCTVSTLAKGASATLKLLVKATALSGTELSDTASATGSTPDPQPGNDSATATSTVA